MPTTAWRRCWPIRGCRWCITVRPTIYMPRLTGRSRRRAARLLRKPLCMTAEEARELVALAARAGVVHGVSFVYRQFAMVQQAAAMIRHGEVGRIFAAHGSYLQDWMLLETDYNWRVDSAQGARRGGRHRLPLVRYRAVYDRSADCRGDGRSVIVWPTRKAPVNGKRPSAPFTRRRHMKRGLSIPRTLARCCCV